MNPIRDRGAVAEIIKPLKLRRYHLANPPEPGEAIDCLVSVNDGSSNDPPRLAFIDGSRVREVAFRDEAIGGAPDVMPLVRSAISASLPALVEAATRNAIASALPGAVDDRVQAVVAAIPAPASSFDVDLKAVARDVLQIADLYQDVLARLIEIEERVSRLDATALRDGDQVHARFMQSRVDQ